MIKKIAYAAAILLFMASCTEEIDVELDSTYTRLVVDGNIESDTGVYRVALTTSSDYFANTPAPRVVNASVYLSDGSQVIQLTESEPGKSGIYQTGSDFAGVIGKNYKLNVELAEPIAGKSSFEASSSLNPVTTLDSIATEFMPEWGSEGVWIVKLWAQDPGDQENYYLFNLYRNGKLMTDTITKKAVSDDMFFNGSYMNGVGVIYLDNSKSWERLNPGDTIMLQMSGITKEYYLYVDQVRMSGFSIPFFSGPPANVQGNVSNGGIGFFTAWSNSFKKGIVR